MARYIDIEKVELKGIAVFDENLDFLVSLSDVWKILQMTPIADVVPKSEYDNLKMQFDALDCECDRLEKAESEKHDKIIEAKAEVAREIFADIEDMCIDLYGNFNHRTFAELKKEYTEKEE